jgi:hypothetical protein
VAFRNLCRFKKYEEESKREKRIHLQFILLYLALRRSYSSQTQETANYGSIGGQVSDATGGARRHRRHRTDRTNRTSALVTDKEGRFRFPYLSVGDYEVKVQQPGFTVAVRPVTLSVGSAFELPISLTVASVKSNVTVTGEATVLETARTQIAGTVQQTEVRSLPLNGRNFLDLALLVTASLPPIRPATSSSPRPPPYPDRAFRWAASAFLKQLHRRWPFRQRQPPG